MNRTQSTIERPVIHDGQHIHERIASVISPLARSDTYVGQRQAGESHVDALGAAIQQAMETTDNESDRNLLTTVGKLGAFVEASHELDSLSALEENGKQLTGTQKKHQRWLKETAVIPFNHSIKEIINTDPAFTIGGLTGALTKSYVGLYGRHDVLRGHGQREHPVPTDEIIEAIRTRINGMRHEVAAETLLTAADLEYDYEVSAQEDGKGADLFVIIDGRRYSIDIKASTNAEKKAHERHSRSHAVWTGLHDRDFTGVRGNSPDSLSIPFDIAQEKAPAFTERIYRVLRLSPELGAVSSTAINSHSRR